VRLLPQQEGGITLKISPATIFAIVGLVIAVAVAGVVLNSDKVPWYPQDEWQDYDVDYINDTLKVGDSYTFLVVNSMMQDSSLNGMYEDTWTIESISGSTYRVHCSHSDTTVSMTKDEFLKYISATSFEKDYSVSGWSKSKDTTKNTPFGYRNVMDLHAGSYSTGYYEIIKGEKGVLFRTTYSLDYTVVDENGDKSYKSQSITTKLKSCNFVYSEPNTSVSTS